MREFVQTPLGEACLGLPDPKKPVVVDRSVFNYGAALGPPKADPLYEELTAPWERMDAHARYQAMATYARALNGIAMQLSASGWKLDMALKHVRDACSKEEQATYMREAETAYVEIDWLMVSVRSEGVAYNRYGRTGTIDPIR